jgi:hypothetical protein
MTTEIALHRATMPEKISYAEHLAHAGLLPDVYRRQPANVLYAIEYGETIGIGTMAAITGVHIIKGKPSASASLIGALVRRAGHRLRVTGNDCHAVAVVIRADDPDFEYRSEWTLERAVTAKLCTLKDGRPYARDTKGEPTAWEKYPAAMLKARAITEVARDACEEVLFGLHYTPEELGAQVDAEGLPATPVALREEPQQPGTDAWSTPVAAVEDEIADAEIVEETAAAPQELTVEQAAAQMRANESTQAPAKPRGATNAMLTKLAILAGEKFVLAGDTVDEARAARLAVVNAELSKLPAPHNAQVDSSKKLTFTQAKMLIDQWEPLPAVEKDAGPAPVPGPNPRNGDGPPLSEEIQDAYRAAYAATEPPQQQAPGADGSWSHQRLADRGTPLPPPGWTAEQADQLAADYMTALNGARTDPERVQIAGQIAAAVKAGKITADQRRVLLDTYNGQQPQRAHAKASA